MLSDYYLILELEPNATKADVKRAYRRLANRWHPDKNRDDDTTDHMKLVNEAYLILNDTDARQRYNLQYSIYKNSQHSDTLNASNINTRTSSHGNDEVLNRWMKNARKQAEAMIRESASDFLGVSKAAISGCYHQVKYIFLILIALIITTLLFR